MEERFGTDDNCTLTVDFFAIIGTDNHRMASITFDGTPQDDVYRWMIRLLEAGRDFQRHLLPMQFELHHVRVSGMQYLADGEESPVEWRMMAPKPGGLCKAIFPPFDCQGREVV